LRLNVSHLRVLAERDAAVAWALAAEVTQRLLDTCAEVEFRLESSVRQRVARWLLELAPPMPDGGGILISQEALAQSVGTAREVVSKVLLELQRDGIISLRRGLISVRNVVGLRAVGEVGGRRLSAYQSAERV
jgi:CRP-like cAMP-binding protein